MSMNTIAAEATGEGTANEPASLMAEDSDRLDFMMESNVNVSFDSGKKTESEPLKGAESPAKTVKPNEMEKKHKAKSAKVHGTASEGKFDDLSEAIIPATASPVTAAPTDAAASRATTAVPAAMPNPTLRPTISPTDRPTSSPSKSPTLPPMSSSPTLDPMYEFFISHPADNAADYSKGQSPEPTSIYFAALPLAVLVVASMVYRMKSRREAVSIAFTNNIIASLMHPCPDRSHMIIIFAVVKRG